MKKIILSSLIVLAMLGGCNNKQLTQQKDEAEKAHEMAIQEAKLAKEAVKRAQQAEANALKQLQIAQERQQVAMRSAEKARETEIQCKTQNKLLQERIKKLEKK